MQAPSHPHPHASATLPPRTRHAPATLPPRSRHAPATLPPRSRHAPATPRRTRLRLNAHKARPSHRRAQILLKIKQALEAKDESLSELHYDTGRLVIVSLAPITTPFAPPQPRRHRPFATALPPQPRLRDPTAPFEPRRAPN